MLPPCSPAVKGAKASFEAIWTSLHIAEDMKSAIVIFIRSKLIQPFRIAMSSASPAPDRLA
jgi:hypothetical protein